MRKGKKHILSPLAGIVILNPCSGKEEEEERGGGGEKEKIL